MTRLPLDNMKQTRTMQETLRKETTRERKRRRTTYKQIRHEALGEGSLLPSKSDINKSETLNPKITGSSNP